MPVYSYRSERRLCSLAPGRSHRIVGWTLHNMVFRSVLTIAGGAALWGLFVLSTHLFWPPPTRELLTIPPQEMPGNDPFHDSADRNLRKVCREGELLRIGAPRALVQLQYNSIPERDLQRLQEHLLVRWPLMSAAELAAGYNAISIDLNSDGWGRLRGSCVRHGVADSEDPSRRGVACTAEEAPLSTLHDLAQLLRAPWANAWSLNVVYAQPRNFKRAGQAGPQDPHVDNLSLHDGDHECSVASSETSVLYLRVPKDMQGGHLTIFESEVKSADKLVPLRHIQAEENLLVRFRGSAPHRVEEFMSSSMRISITLEQYQLPALLYQLVPHFQVKRIQY